YATEVGSQDQVQEVGHGSEQLYLSADDPKLYFEKFLAPKDVAEPTELRPQGPPSPRPPFSAKCRKHSVGWSAKAFSLCINRQVLREYACVVTRPAPKGFGSSVERALSEIAEFEAFYCVLPDPEGVWMEWKRLVTIGNCTGLSLHDAYIAAVMVRHGLSGILTLNTKDFDIFQEIRPVTPATWKELAQVPPF
ncbi:MAG: type II toxin-antitoxin system VapC family toxin, partial [Pseudomonadota bacterium]